MEVPVNDVGLLRKLLRMEVPVNDVGLMRKLLRLEFLVNDVGFLRLPLQMEVPINNDHLLGIAENLVSMISMMNIPADDNGLMPPSAD